MSYLTLRERNTAQEVIAQYDLSPAQVAEVWVQLERAALQTPFTAYAATHRICAEIERGTEA